MKKKILAVFLLIVICFSFTACNPSLKLLGKWKVVEVETGKVDMDKNDVKDMGGLDLGFIKINKSGKCKIDFLGDEYDGTWTGSGTDKLDSNTKISFKYGDNITSTGTFDGDMLIVKDSQGAEYRLEK